MGEEAGSLKLVRAILQLGKEPGIHTVAEGVESSDQLKKLRAWGCEFAQGYLFAKPMQANEENEFLKSAAKYQRKDPALLGEEIGDLDP